MDGDAKAGSDRLTGRTAVVTPLATSIAEARVNALWLGYARDFRGAPGANQPVPQS